MLRRIAALVVVIVLTLFVVSRLYDIPGSGFGAYVNTAQSQFERPKTLWDWMDLLLVPAILAAAALWFNEQSRRRENKLTKDRFLEDAMQTYYERMTQTLLETDPPHSAEALLRVRQLRTITALRRLDPKRVQDVLNFLRTSNWLSGDQSILSGADLTEIDMSEANLSEADLSEAVLVAANLQAADLFSADLTNADLTFANLSQAYLNGAILTNANLNLANLRGADLSQADLRDAFIDGAEFDSETILPNGKPCTALADFLPFTNPPPS
ncbi:MAG: pentapeptide repeat-containing protein, partial [Anaerolineae bacterium]|nr:pentapeptide repeat-containing protein [Anaerolineae bacterium]